MLALTGFGATREEARMLALTVFSVKGFGLYLYLNPPNPTFL